MFKRILNTDNQIIDDFFDEENGNKDVLTIQLIVEKDLEPRWYVTNGREDQDDIEIRANDRAKLNTFIISDYIDKHFSWGKGTPLYSLLKKNGDEIDTDKIIVDANRKAHDSIKDRNAFESFGDLVKKIKESALSLGLSLEELNVLIDFKSFLLREGSIVLHDESDIPIRLKGKGTKRLLSIAIQLELIKEEGGIILIDEVEQGLEPDRAKFLVKYLKDNNNQGQVFITTHSNNVLVELEYKDIVLKKETANGLFTFDDSFQGCLRRNPNAFFARRVIVCEGATEVGICRALNEYRIVNNMKNLEFLAISLVDGTGNSFVDYCLKFKEAGFDVCAFCDSDENRVNERKEELISVGIELIDCYDNNAIEQQLFNDLPWGKVISVLQYMIEVRGEQSIFSQLSVESLDDLTDRLEDRCKIGAKAKHKDNGWFKKIEHGEKLGYFWFESLNEIEGTRLKEQFDTLTNWIDKE